MDVGEFRRIDRCTSRYYENNFIGKENIMRSGMQFLALCGVVGLALSVGMAQDRDQFLQTKRTQKSSRSSFRYFSKAGKEDSIKAHTHAKNLQPAKFPEKMATAIDRQTPNMSKAGVTNADFTKSKGKNKGKVVRTVSMQRSSSVTHAMAETSAPFPRVPASLDPPVPPLGRNRVIPASMKSVRRNQDGPDQSRQETFGQTSRRPATGPQTSVVTLKWEKDGVINIGQPSHCKLVVRNAGEYEVEDIFVKVQFPEFVEITNSTPVAEVQGVTYAWQFRSLAAGESQTIGIEFLPSTGGNFTADAKVRYTGSATEVFKIRHPELSIAMKGPKEVMIGDLTAHYVTITNPGTGVANNVSLEAILPEGLEHPRGKRLLMKVGSLNPGESRSIRLALTAVKGGDYSVKVRANAD